MLGRESESRKISCFLFLRKDCIGILSRHGEDRIGWEQSRRTLNFSIESRVFYSEILGLLLRWKFRKKNNHVLQNVFCSFVTQMLKEHVVVVCGVFVCTQAGQRLLLNIFLNWSPPEFFRLPRLTGQWSPKIHLHLPPHHWAFKYMPLFLVCILGILI